MINLNKKGVNPMLKRLVFLIVAVIMFAIILEIAGVTDIVGEIHLLWYFLGSKISLLMRGYAVKLVWMALLPALISILSMIIVLNADACAGPIRAVICVALFVSLTAMIVMGVDTLTGSIPLFTVDAPSIEVGGYHSDDPPASPEEFKDEVRARSFDCFDMYGRGDISPLAGKTPPNPRLCFPIYFNLTEPVSLNKLENHLSKSKLYFKEGQSMSLKYHKEEKFKYKGYSFKVNLSKWHLMDKVQFNVSHWSIDWGGLNDSAMTGNLTTSDFAVVKIPNDSYPVATDVHNPDDKFWVSDTDTQGMGDLNEFCECLGYDGVAPPEYDRYLHQYVEPDQGDRYQQWTIGSGDSPSSCIESTDISQSGEEGAVTHVKCKRSSQSVMDTVTLHTDTGDVDLDVYLKRTKVGTNLVGEPQSVAHIYIGDISEKVESVTPIVQCNDPGPDSACSPYDSYNNGDDFQMKRGKLYIAYYDNYGYIGGLIHERKGGSVCDPGVDIPIDDPGHDKVFWCFEDVEN